MYSYEYPRPALTVDSVIICFGKDIPHVLLIERMYPPFAKKWALPGGFVSMNENLETAAKRELLEETGLNNVKLTQFYTFGDLNRDPRGRTVSVVYYGSIEGENPQVEGGDDAAQAKWFPIDKLPPLAFDHQHIIDMLMVYLKFK